MPDLVLPLPFPFHCEVTVTGKKRQFRIPDPANNLAGLLMNYDCLDRIMMMMTMIMERFSTYKTTSPAKSEFKILF